MNGRSVGVGCWGGREQRTTQACRRAWPAARELGRPWLWPQGWQMWAWPQTIWPGSGCAAVSSCPACSMS